jgi:PAS domain S-box-containing protein
MQKHDLAEPGRALETHSSEEKRYRDLVENLNDIIYSTDLEGRIAYISPPIAALTGYRPHEMTGRPFSDFIHPEDLQRIRNQFVRILGGVIEPSEYRIMSKSGETRWVKSSSRAIYTDGKATGIQGVVTDITEHKRIDEALEQRERELIANSRELAEINTAMRVMLRQLQNDREEFEQKVMTNVSKLIMPHVEKLKKSCLAKRDLACVAAIESQLKDIISPFIRKLSRDFNLSPKELRIVNFIREGKTSKDIANLLHLSKGTVDIYRNQVRKKLGINGKQNNLKLFLASIL